MQKKKFLQFYKDQRKRNTERERQEQLEKAKKGKKAAKKKAKKAAWKLTEGWGRRLVQFGDYRVFIYHIIDT